jgi:hypothetical protein
MGRDKGGKYTTERKRPCNQYSGTGRVLKYLKDNKEPRGFS